MHTKDTKNHRLYSALLFLAGVLVFAFGIFRGAITLACIIGTVCWIAAMCQWLLGGADGPEDKKNKKIKNIIMGAFGLLLIIGGVLLIVAAWVYEDYLEALATVSAIFLIFGIVLFRFAQPEKEVAFVMGQRKVPELQVDVDKLYDDLKDVDTILGKPWLSHVTTITDRDCIIWGPASNGSFVYGYYLSGTFQLSNSPDMDWIEDKEAARAHVVNVGSALENDDPITYFLNLEIRACVNYYYQMIKNYALTGQAQWPTEVKPLRGKLYAFDASFALTKQVYHLVDEAGNVVYNVEGTLPLKTFKITAPTSKEELFKITKRLFHIMDHYDFYFKGQPFGRMAQRFNWLHDLFELDTPSGKVTMLSDDASLGNNYYIFLNGELIGTLAQKIGFRIRDVVFDNYVVCVYREEYLALIAGLAIMAEREYVRDHEAGQNV